MKRTDKGRHWRCPNTRKLRRPYVHCPNNRKLCRHRRCQEKRCDEIKWNKRVATGGARTFTKVCDKQKTESPQAVPREMKRRNEKNWQGSPLAVYARHLRRRCRWNQPWETFANVSAAFTTHSSFGSIRIGLSSTMTRL